MSTESGGFREYVVKLFGSDVYFYEDENQLIHEFMHTLVGTFISLEVAKRDEETGQSMYPIKIGMPPKFSRRIYFTDKAIQDKWLGQMKKVSRSKEFADFYNKEVELG